MYTFLPPFEYFDYLIMAYFSQKCNVLLVFTYYYKEALKLLFILRTKNEKEKN